ncbi:hypothetical protein AB0M39_38335, partial [Streptomyces sp. NPDC051907]|uniref:hypothetical protein n=1 Tax=Streptomyces sp. NPDC051907 TaxID=3155284 RepID=UPI00343C767E
MLKAYVRRLNGETTPVGWQHTGQHLGVTEGAVRLARLYWEQGLGDASDPEHADREQRARELLRSVVPLLDVLILTRVAPDGSERVVFHGLAQEVSSMDHHLSLIAADNPTAQRLFDQPLHLDGPLIPTDRPYPAEAGRPGHPQPGTPPQ